MIDLFERTLIITPHFDDETIGCGGLIAKLSKDPQHIIMILEIAEHKDMYNLNVDRKVGDDERFQEALNALSYLKLDENNIIRCQNFLDGRLDTVPIIEIISILDYHIKNIKPTAVLFPYSSHHQDHQVTYRASVAALRPTVDKDYLRLTAMYEYPYINNWSSNLNPNSKLYIKLTEDELKMKRRALSQYRSQLLRDPKDILSVESIIRLAEVRGVEIGCKYAEAFYPMSITY